MARPRGIPTYRFHKARNSAVVRIEGRDHYLGAYGSPESHEKYARLIAEHAATPKTGTAAASDIGDRSRCISIIELVAGFWSFAQQHYRRDGRPTGHCNSARAALRPLVELYGSTAANDFGPQLLKAVREHMIEKKSSRSYINGCISTIRRAFAWAVEEEVGRGKCSRRSAPRAWPTEGPQCCPRDRSGGAGR